MTPDQIIQLRQLLKNAINYKGDYAYDYIIGKCKKVLTLLPCPTCNGTSQIPTKQSAGFGDGNAIMQDCPDCR